MSGVLFVPGHKIKAMDIEIKQKKYRVPRKYWPWIGGGVLVIALLVWLALGNFTSTLQVDTRGLSIATVTDAQFDDYVSLDGNVVPIQVVQISPEEGGVVVEKVVDEGSKVHKGDVIVRLSNSNLDLEILNAESELAEKQDMLRNTQLSMEQDQLNNRTEAPCRKNSSTRVRTISRPKKTIGSPWRRIASFVSDSARAHRCGGHR